jgi:hypothetical protein
MEPAGGGAGTEGRTTLPPSSLKQPEPARSRTRRPGDKWLKTSSSSTSTAPNPPASPPVNSTPATSGFTFISTHTNPGSPPPRRACGSSEGARETPLSDDGVPTPNEQHARAVALGLSPSAERLYCFEPQADNITRGAARGSVPVLYTPVYQFQGGPAAAPTSAHRPAAAAPARTVAPLGVPAHGTRWWWHAQEGGKGEQEEGKAEEGANEEVVGGAQENAGVEGGAVGGDRGGKAGGSNSVPAAEKKGQNGVVKKEGDDGEVVVQSAAAALLAVATARVAQVKPERGGGGGGGGVGGGGGEGKPSRAKAAGGEEGGGGKTKRVWRRWDSEEERRLRDAVLRLGTKVRGLA